MLGNTGALDAKTIRLKTPLTPRSPAIAKPRTAPTAKAMPPRASTKEHLRGLETKAFSESKAVPGVSLFAIVGTVVVTVLMVFVVLAQISYNEAANEAVRLNTELRQLSEQHRTLELTFESSFDIREIERIAKDELGMSHPDRTQVYTIASTPRDTAIVVIGEEDTSSQGFVDFLRSLTDYFRR